MRLSKIYIKTIKEATIKYFGSNAKVYLFGSRVDDTKKGGDIDLYIETECEEELLDKKLMMLSYLHKNLGEQKIDIVINNNTDNLLIYQVAKDEGILL